MSIVCRQFCRLHCSCSRGPALSKMVLQLGCTTLNIQLCPSQLKDHYTHSKTRLALHYEAPCAPCLCQQAVAANMRSLSSPNIILPISGCRFDRMHITHQINNRSIPLACVIYASVMYRRLTGIIALSRNQKVCQLHLLKVLRRQFLKS